MKLIIKDKMKLRRVALLAMIWLNVGTRDAQEVLQRSRRALFWLVLPSLILFLLLPLLLAE